MERALKYLGISMGLSFASAIAYVVVLTLTLPASDEAHGQLPFADPLVLPIMAMVAGLSGLIGWPLFVLFGWRVRPKTVAKATGVSVLVFIVAATPFRAAYGWPGCYIVCLLALVCCAIWFRQDSEPVAPPNGGPGTPSGNSGAVEGPPSVG
jgi:hypothetical protein